MAVQPDGTARPGAAALVFKIVPAALWHEAEAAGRFTGAGVDVADGFIHFSTAAQIRDTAAKHFAGVTGLLLAAVDTGAIAAALRWEPSRGGDLFPHLYESLPIAAVRWTAPLPLGGDGRHDFPAALAGEGVRDDCDA